MKEIQTERLFLRQLTTEDAEEMFRNWTSDDEVTKYLTWPTHHEISETVEFLEYCVNDQETNPACRRWGITLRETGALIGSIDIVDRIDGVPELGYVIGRAYWGKGYMTEVVRAVRDSLLAEGEKAILIEADVRNIASCRVAEKCGFLFQRKAHRLCSVFKPYEVEVNWYRFDAASAE